MANTVENTELTLRSEPIRDGETLTLVRRSNKKGEVLTIKVKETGQIINNYQLNKEINARNSFQTILELMREQRAADENLLDLTD
jgi:hypothetical protein